jgi:hypothetical protein
MSTCLAGTLLENLRNSMWEIPSDKSASGDGTARQLDVKRPTRAVEELHQVAATRTERRQHAAQDKTRPS